MGGIKSLFRRQQAEAEGSPYTYSQLGPRQIRLVQVSRKRWTSQRICCRFTVVDLDNCPQPYSSISYCWGPPAFNNKIWFENDHYLLVTNSAATILHSLSKAGADQFYWIDAICIDQSNPKERSSQVQLMYSVYSFAEQVLAFPGEHLQDCRLALQFVVEIGRYIDQLGDAQRENFSAVELTQMQDFNWPSLKWTALTCLLEQPFFTRVWIIQEMVAAKKTKVMCGSAYLDWDYLDMVLFFIKKAGATGLLRHAEGRSNVIADGAIAMGSIASVRDFITRLGSGPPLALLLVSSAMWGATDPRDRIFALRNISAEATDKLLEADYTKSERDVFTSATQHLLVSRQGSICLLSAAGIGLDRRLENLPSWVPDWTARNPTRSFALMAESSSVWYQNQKIYQACSGTPTITYNARAGSLLIRVQIIDEVQCVASARPKLIFQGEDTRESKTIHAPLLAWIKEISQLLPPHLVYSTGERVFPDVVSRTLFGDADSEGKPMPASIGLQFLNYFAIEYLMVRGNPNESSGGRIMDDDIPDAAAQVIATVASLAWDSNPTSTYLGPDGKSLSSSEVRRIYGEAPFIPTEIMMSAMIFATLMPITQTYRRMFKTSHGYLGVGPEFMQPDDQICLVHGAGVPFILRRRDNGGHLLVGESYVHGIMHGEGMNIGQQHDVELF